MTEDTRREIATVWKNQSEDIKVSLTEFKGHHLIDIRVYADNGFGGPERSPTKKGITCKVDKLGAIIEAMQEAERIALQNGLIQHQEAVQ